MPTIDMVEMQWQHCNKFFMFWVREIRLNYSRPKQKGENMLNKKTGIRNFGWSKKQNASDLNPVLAETVVLQNNIIQKYCITEPKETFVVQLLCLATNTYPKVLDCFCQSENKEQFFMNVLKSNISTKAHAEIMKLSQQFFDYGLLNTLVTKFPATKGIVKAQLTFNGCRIIKKLFANNPVVFLGEMRTAFEIAVCDDVFSGCEFVDFEATDDFTLSVGNNRVTFMKGKYHFYIGNGWIVWEVSEC